MTPTDARGARIVRLAERDMAGRRSYRFEGETLGGGVSFFLVRALPGEGPGLHVHPYSETWIVEAGRALLVADGETSEVGPGDIAVVPAGVAHKFTAIGEDRLEMTCIHAAAKMEQTDLE